MKLSKGFIVGFLIGFMTIFVGCNWMIFDSDVPEFDPSVVTELKRYKTVEDFWYSDFGGGIIDQIVSCNKNRVEGD